ncbi:MAG: hypothetical protein ABIG37_02925 [Nanoarchaeota archaeon]|nr:hypothetical protein [Nanoarchaeota archaeon]
MSQKVVIPARNREIVEVQPASVIEQYIESAKAYNSKKAKETLGVGNCKVSVRGDEFAGSSPFINILLANLDSDNPGVFPNKQIPVTRDVLERAVFEDKEFLKMRYSDFGLALITPTDNYKPNNLLAERLAEQLEKRKINLKTGKLIHFNAFSKPIEHDNSAYGLILDLRDDFSKDNLLDSGLVRDLSEFSWDCNGSEGLPRTCFGSDMDWYWEGRNLGGSGSSGRVVGVGVDAHKGLVEEDRGKKL